MKIILKPKITVDGYSQLHGVDYRRIKARSKEPNFSHRSDFVDRLRASLNDAYHTEYRIIKEKDGYIFRDVLGTSGISGHHKTVKKCIITALPFVDIFIDEPFEHEGLPEFISSAMRHESRNLYGPQPK